MNITPERREYKRLWQMAWRRAHGVKAKVVKIETGERCPFCGGYLDHELHKRLPCRYWHKVIEKSTLLRIILITGDDKVNELQDVLFPWTREPREQGFYFAYRSIISPETQDMGFEEGQKEGGD